jgi:hypothetical protein
MEGNPRTKPKTTRTRRDQSRQRHRISPKPEEKHRTNRIPRNHRTRVSKNRIFHAASVKSRPQNPRRTTAKSPRRNRKIGVKGTAGETDPARPAARTLSCERRVTQASRSLRAYAALKRANIWATSVSFGSIGGGGVRWSSGSGFVDSSSLSCWCGGMRARVCLRVGLKSFFFPLPPRLLLAPVLW